MTDSAIASRGTWIGHRWVSQRTAGTWLIYAAVAALLAIPILAVDIPLGVDDLNHFARISILAHIATDPDLARLFEVRHGLIPYLGMDLLLTPLARMLPIMLVGRLYTLTLVWALLATVVVLRRTFTGRIGLAPAFAALIVYNGLMAYGLINYELGMILALLAFAAWHSQRARPWPVRLVLFTIVTTILYTTHLLAFVLYGVLVTSYEALGRPRPWRTPILDWMVLATQALPGVLLWTVTPTQLPATIPMIDYQPITLILAPASPFLFAGTVGGLDTGWISVWFCAAALSAGLRRGWLVCSRPLAAPILVLLTLTLILPDGICGVSLIDYRFAVPAACLTLAGLGLTSSARPFAAPLAIALALLTVLHVGDVTVMMHRCDTQYAELREALTAIPRGAEMITMQENAEPTAGAACSRLPIYDHIGQLVTIDRSGYAPDFFSWVTSVAVRDGRRTDLPPIVPQDFASAPAADYVLWIHFGRHGPVPAGLTLLRTGSFFDIWTVAR